MAPRQRREEEGYEEERPRYRPRQSSKFPILSFFGIAIIVIGAGLLLFITSRKQSLDTGGRAVPTFKALDLPDPPGYTKWDETSSDFVKNNKNPLVIAIYSYGQRSTVRGVTEASKRFNNHDFIFLLGDHDMCRIPVNELAGEGILSTAVQTPDCPLIFFFKDGSEVYKEKAMTIQTVQEKIDELYHGGVDSLKEAGDILDKKTK